jgi:xylulokinase
VGAGAFKNIAEACAATIRVVQETPANRKNAKHYQQAFPVYQGLYQSLRGDFKRIAALG